MRLVVVCWNDDEKLWEVELEEQAGEAGGTILPILAEPSGGNKPRSRVHPKTSKDEQASDEV